MKSGESCKAYRRRYIIRKKTKGKRKRTVGLFYRDISLREFSEMMGEIILVGTRSLM